MKTPFPAYKGDEPYVFICYAHEDARLVYPELQKLKDSNANVFYDEGISPGNEWTQELANAIDGCAQLIFFASPASTESQNCRNEVRYWMPCVVGLFYCLLHRCFDG